MPVHVYSTLTASNAYRTYRKSVNDMQEIMHTIHIKGGTNVADRHLVTPRGVLTTITEDQLEILKLNPDFKRHHDGGFITYDTVKVDPEVKAANMQTRDDSAPLTPNDFDDRIDVKDDTLSPELRAKPIEDKKSFKARR